MIYFVAIFFGLAPSFIWLLLFLRRDVHPESNRMILKIFFYGMAITIVALLAEPIILRVFFGNLEELLKTQAFFPIFFYQFLGIAFVEEFLKYWVVRQKVLKHPEFDEPVDAMLYMIIAALGFAALENILVLLPPGTSFPFLGTIATSFIRFAGATFLHALCSGVVGYFLALSLFETKKRIRLVITGLLIATLLHGLYNSYIMKLDENIDYIIIPVIILVGSAFFISFGFKKLKKLASVCKTL